ncbi:MAG TPA: hypothetical protein VHP30_11540, partial [Ignavibacteriales bacterium]|nr:hypothetical protein [Ignavibacteriales bacterium]
NRPGYPYCILNMDAFSANRKLSTESAAAICRVFIEKYRDLRVFVSGEIRKSAPAVKAINPFRLKRKGRQCGCETF